MVRVLAQLLARTNEVVKYPMMSFRVFALASASIFSMLALQSCAGDAIGRGVPPVSGSTMAESTSTLDRVFSTRSHDTAEAKAAFFFSDGAPGQNGVLEYARNATRHSRPIRNATITGRLFGVDKSGQLYSYVVPYPGAPCSPCKIFVQGSTGHLSYTLVLRSGVGNAAYPIFPFVDAAGDIYYELADCSRIYEYGPGARGNAPPPIRFIKIPKAACVQSDSSSEQPQFPVFADNRGGVYLRGSRGRNAFAEYIWAPGASGGSQTIRRLFGPAMQRGLQGVDSKGNIWVRGGNTYAGEIPPSANGKVQPVVVPLQGIADIQDILIASNDQIIYDGPVSIVTDKPFVMNLARPRGGNPVKTIELKQSLLGFLTLYGVSF